MIALEKMDLHVHTNYSDGAMSIKEAIQVAQTKNLSYLAITDHFTTSWKQSIIKTLKASDFETYRDQIEREREQANFKCLIGLEIDMDSNWDDVLKVPFEWFEIINFEYAESMVLLKKIAVLVPKLKKGSICTLAHNFYFKIANLEEFSKILLDNNICFELNARYLIQFDENSIQRLKFLREKGIQFTIGSDAHEPEKIGKTDEVLSILKKIEGFQNLLDLRDFPFY
ncbi:MAG: PHP domain-containing protein [Candidatus Helarchaeota archaeon]|nr:PHP domain-containing protein [Candidatus Helarchaeota archaeon]